MYPQLSDASLSLFVTAYGVLLLGHLLLLLPHSRRFFVSERWRGYAQSSWDVDIIQNPVAHPVVMATWLACAVALTVGRWTLPAALINLLLCRYFFVHMRWKGVLRGMGAPGFMTYWLAAAVTLLIYTTKHAPDLRSLALLVLQVDFALIILSAGVYKFAAGFPRNQGLELGLANPEWGYWWRFYSARSPQHFTIRALNQIAWTTEIAAAAFMLIPQTRFLGAVLIIVTFFAILTHIRLALLCQMVMLSGVLFFHPGSAGDRLAELLFAAPSRAAELGAAGPATINIFLFAFLWGYLLLLPLGYAGIYYNFFARKRLPSLVQRVLDVYTNFFGIIMWRVFTADLINFFPKIYRQRRDGRRRRLISRYGWRAGSIRYSHVAEAITLTSLFTTLKYYPSNFDLFAQRLLRYSRTITCAEDEVLVFEYVSVTKTETAFHFTSVAEFVVDGAAGTVTEHVLMDGVDVRAPHPGSPLHEGSCPGTYAPR